MNSEPKDYADATDDDGAEREISSLICDGLAAIELPAAQRAGLRRALLPGDLELTQHQRQVDATRLRGLFEREPSLSR